MIGMRKICEYIIYANAGGGGKENGSKKNPSHKTLTKVPDHLPLPELNPPYHHQLILKNKIKLKKINTIQYNTIQ